MAMATPPPAWLAHFTQLHEVAAGVHAALAHPEAMPRSEAVEWTNRIATALERAAPEVRSEAEAQGWALTGLLIEEAAAGAFSANRECEAAARVHVSDIASVARILAEPACLRFGVMLRDLYKQCRASPFPRMVEFCRGRWERLERAQGPACASMGSVGEDSHEADRPSGDTLRFAVVTGLLHADELDALGETLAAEVSELSGRGVTYVSDSAFDYAPSCTGAYVPELRDGDWSVMVLGGEEGGSLDVSRLGRTEFAYVAEFSGHRPASWQRAARALHLDDADFGMGGLGVTFTTPRPLLSVFSSYGLPRSVGTTWRAIEAVVERCLRWGTIEAVVSVSATGAPVRATLRKPRLAAFDVEGARCFAAGVQALLRRGRAVGRAELEVGPDSEPHMHTFPPHSMPRVEACAEGEPMDVCIAANPDGSVRQWSAALSWEFMPRALVDLVPTPIAPDAQRCMAQALEHPLPCTQRGDDLALLLPLAP
jgi:hypothetical protein